MATHRLGLVMHGVTGRMGLNQHLQHSILAIRDAGGVALANGDRVVPEPLLLGRNDRKLGEIARRPASTPTPPTTTRPSSRRSTACSSTRGRRSCGATHVDRRWDEQGQAYAADADDAAYAVLQLEGGIVAQVSSSWCTRVNRDDLAGPSTRRAGSSIRRNAARRFTHRAGIIALAAKSQEPRAKSLLANRMGFRHSSRP